MKENKNEVSARMVFVADKMLAKMKKCLKKKDKKDICEFLVNPAIEMETGLLLATNGQILAAHKLKDYDFMPSESAVLGNVVMMPVAVLQMKGRVEVTVTVVDYDLLTTCTDEKGTTAELRTRSKYPFWRSVIPRTTGWPIDVEAKAWDAALKEIVPKVKDIPLNAVRLYGEAKSKTLALCWDNVDTDNRGKKDVNVGEMPFKMAVSVNGLMLRDAMAFQPTEMRFSDWSNPLFFYSEDTLCLMMPVVNASFTPCGADKKCLSDFDLEKWIGVDMGTVVVDNTKDVKPETVKPETKREPTMEERLREALLKQLPQLRNAA